jgi:hypothetical protein
MKLKTPHNTESSYKFKDFLRSGDNDKLSSSALWFHIANIAVTLMYFLMGFTVYHMSTPNIMDFAILTGVYAGIVTGNKFANTFLSYKYASETKEVKSETELKAVKKEVKHDTIS